MEEETLSSCDPYIYRRIRVALRFGDVIVTEPGQFRMGKTSFGLTLSPYKQTSVSQI